MRVRDIAVLLNSEWEGDGDREITGASTLDAAGPNEISFVANAKAVRAAADSRAGCLLVRERIAAGEKPLIFSADPRAAIARVIAALHIPRQPEQGVHASAIVAKTAVIGDGSSVGPGCVIGENVRIGAQCVLHPNVTIYPDATIGERVILHAGCVIGADGFGFVFRDGRYENFPQIGRVEIGDDVEIGANSCVDRAALGVTTIGDGTKFDNMVHIAHNCRIGKHVVIAAQTGLAGGVVVEDYAVIGGQVGIGDKARIESRAVLGSGAGVLTSKVVRGGQVYWGTPARPLKEYLEQLAAIGKLSDILAELRELRKRLAQ